MQSTQDLLVLCYHAVSDDWPTGLAVTRADLEHEVTSLLRRGFQASTFSDAVTRPVARPTFVVTFDDAFQSVFSRGLPLLARLGVPGTIFVPTQFPSQGLRLTWSSLSEWADGPHADELRSMTWDHLRETAGEGWEIGAHSSSHPHLTTLPEDALGSELQRSKAACEDELGLPCRALAYPFSDYDQRVVEKTAEVGFDCAATVPPRLWSPYRYGRFEVPRIGMYRNDSKLIRRARASRALRRLRGWKPYARTIGRHTPLETTR